MLESVKTDRVAEYINLEWKLLGNLVSTRYGHSSIKLGSTIYTFGGFNSDKHIYNYDYEDYYQFINER